MTFSKVLPDHMLTKVSPADRAKLGKAGQTAAETIAKAAIKNERDLQKQIVSFLRMKGIEPIVSRMDKRTSNNLGTPDILFAVRNLVGYTVALAWEVKFGDGKTSKEQDAMWARMTSLPNSWRWMIVRSLDDAILELKRVGFLV